MIHLLDENQANKFYDVDFKPVEQQPAVNDNLIRVDHIGWALLRALLSNVLL
ncbi:hypothetical protein OH492_13530 [Vibrio chagasii]|nr:hypothetical protein [Vibrio chagasii]